MMLARIGFVLAKPWLHRMDAETAHRLTIHALKALPRLATAGPRPLLSCRRFGLDFPNPLGLAAGFDKDGEVADKLFALGFGFVEIGTVTPEAQSGNPPPRLFRLKDDQAVINRMGFNNAGQKSLRQRLERLGRKDGILGINLGANKDSDDRIGDYATGLANLGSLASYVTINISSPNTPGLRNLQSADQIVMLLDSVNKARASLARRVPLLLKLAPDLSDEDLDEIAPLCTTDRIDGVILTNTTLSRQGLRSPEAREAGGVSGRPLFELATRKLAYFYVATEGRIPLIGVGGIATAEQAWRKIEAGASLLQIYSALVYEGPGLIPLILDGLEDRLRAEGQASLDAIVGREALRLKEERVVI